MDGYLFLRHFYRYEKAQDDRLVLLSFVFTWSYVGIKRILVGPNAFRFSFNHFVNMIYLFGSVIIVAIAFCKSKSSIR
jgi:hypothetical protein